MNWRQLASRLQPGMEVLIFTHEKPDGDAWGCSFGLGLILEELGCKPMLMRPLANISDTFSWLPGQHLIRCVPKEELRIPPGAAVAVLDCGDPERCEYALDRDGVLLNADHHVGNTGYGQVVWHDESAGATAQVLCRLLFEAGIHLPPGAATCFYYALVTDTGAFRFSNTGAETLKIASALAEQGADLAMIRERLWESRPGKELVLLHLMLDGRISAAQGKAVICPLPYGLVMDSGIYDAETDNALETIRSVEGVEAVMLLKENEPGTVKLSIRTKRELDGAAFMARIGGGGHVRAAGATFNGSMGSAIATVKALLEESLG